MADERAESPAPASAGRRVRVRRRPQAVDDAIGLATSAWRVSRGRFVVELVLLFLVGIIGGASLLLLVPIVNSIAVEGVPQPLDMPLVGAVDLSGVPLGVLLGAVVALTALQAGLQRWSEVNSEALGETTAQHLRTSTFDSILAARWSFILQRQRSDIIAVAATGAQRAKFALNQLLTGAVTLVVAVVTAGVALLVEPTLSAIAIGGTLLLGAVLSTTIRRAYLMGERLGDSNREVQSVMTDSLDSFRLVRAHDAAEVWRRELAAAFDGSREAELAYVRHTSTRNAVSQVGLVASAAVLVLTAVWLAVPPATIVLVLLLIARLARSVQQLASIAQRVAWGLPAVREISDLTAAARAAAEHPAEPSAAVRAAAEHPAEPGAAAAAPGQTAVVDLREPRPGAPEASARPPTVPSGVPSGVPLVRLAAASFHYASSGGGISAVSFDVPTGRLTALTGPSGSGKSTTADLVLGLLEPDSGEVLIDGVPLTHAGLRAWRARVAYVPQETVLIPGTLRKNLLWSVGAASDDDCWHALDRAAAAFARTLPDGLDTEVGDRGIRLSGGERQRVAIARALLRKPDLLVLDEATSSLDDATESAVLETLAGLSPEVTTLVIAHRRSTIDAADHVVALERGRLAGVR